MLKSGSGRALGVVKWRSLFLDIGCLQIVSLEGELRNLVCLHCLCIKFMSALLPSCREKLSLWSMKHSSPSTEGD